jgi:hypothetical protein
LATARRCSGSARAARIPCDRPFPADARRRHWPRLPVCPSARSYDDLENGGNVDDRTISLPLLRRVPPVAGDLEALAREATLGVLGSVASLSAELLLPLIGEQVEMFWDDPESAPATFLAPSTLDIAISLLSTPKPGAPLRPPGLACGPGAQLSHTLLCTLLCRRRGRRDGRLVAHHGCRH